MNAENLVTRLEISQRIAKLGVTKPSLFYWLDKDNLIYRKTHNCCGCIPAYTAGEIGWILPNDPRIHDAFVACKVGQRLGGSHTVSMIRDPDFLADMLCWLLENGKLTLEECNGNKT